jgi:hypothetical protein
MPRRRPRPKTTPPTVNHCRPTWAELATAAQPGQTFSFSGTTDGGEGHHVIEGMTREQRGLYSLWWHAFAGRSILADIFREYGDSIRANEVEAISDH